MKKSSLAFFLIGLFFCPVFSAAPEVLSISSPNKSVRVDITTDQADQLIYQVFFNQSPVIGPCPLGITVDNVVYGKQTAIIKTAADSGSDSFACLGKKSMISIKWEQLRVDLKNANGDAFSVVFRIFNDGIAFRYEVPGTGERTVSGEETAFSVIRNSTIWYQQNFKWFESVYLKKKVEQVQDWDTIALPATFELADKLGYICITEANLADYSGMQLQRTKDNVFKAVFKTDTSWKLKDMIITPWRVVFLAGDLNTLYNSDIITGLCPEPDKTLFPKGVQTDWIKPGRCVWSWLGDSNRSESRLDFETMKDYVEMASILGFEYNLVDLGWEDWKRDGKDARWEMVRELVEFANVRNVKIWLWKDSRDGMFDAQKRRDFFRQCRGAGVVGVKLDFMENDNQFTVRWYIDTLRDGAECQLLVDFHGASKPTGLSRTWPNELTREGIYGLEQGLQELGQHHTILPFVRYMAGVADYTPLHFGCKKAETTWTHQIAAAILFTSPFLCLADHPVHYVTNPAANFIRSIPATWDESIILPFTRIGEVTGTARRAGRDWYIAIINGSMEKTIDVELSCLPKDKTYKADLLFDDPSSVNALVKKQFSYTSKDRISLSLQKGGGFAARFSEVDFLKPLELTAEQRVVVDQVARGDFETIFKAVRRSVAEKNAAAKKQRISDRLEAYFKSCAPKLKNEDYIADSLEKTKVPVALIKEICSLNKDETILGGTIDLEQHDSPLFVFTNYALYVVTAKVYWAFLNQPEQFDYYRGVWHNYSIIDYGELKTMNTWDLPLQRGYQLKDGVFYSGYDSQIPDCLAKMISYIKSESNIYMPPKSVPVEPMISVPFIKGHTFLVFTDRQSDLPAIAASLDRLAATNADSVCIVTQGRMDAFDSPGIVKTSNDDIINSVIKMAKQRNLRVILKPMIEPNNGVWRSWVNFFDNNGNQDLVHWQEWWNNYEQFILYYARLAEQAKAEMFCLGCEMGSTEQFESKWRYLIRQVRGVYHGLLTYNVNHAPLDNIKWWDAVDVIGISAYFYLEGYVQQAGRKTGQGNVQYRIPLEDMKAGLEIVRKNLREYAEKWNKPVFFIECGLCNAKGCAREPWTHPGPSLIYDQQEQADYYTAMFETFYSESWFIGYAWWAWPAILYNIEDAKTDISFSIYGKAAENTVKEWYSKSRIETHSDNSDSIQSTDLKATPETAALFRNLKAFSGKGVLFGHQDTLAYGIGWKDHAFDSDVYKVCGDFPAVFGWDLGHIGEECNIDGVPFARMKEWMSMVYQKKGINTISWHMKNPATNKSAWDTTPVAGRLLQDGDLHKEYLAKLDSAAAFLSDLKGQKGEPVPVVLRLFHEQNGSWFWWGKNNCTADEYKKLWRFTVDYLRKQKNLHNLLICFSTDAFKSPEEYLETWPGDDYVDILGVDDYKGLQSPDQKDWAVQMMETVVNLAEQKKKIAIVSETGLLRVTNANWWTGSVLKALTTNKTTRKIVWILVWRNFNTDHFWAPYPGQTSEGDFKQFYKDDHTRFLSDMPDLYEISNF